MLRAKNLDVVFKLKTIDLLSGVEILLGHENNKRKQYRRTRYKESLGLTHWSGAVSESPFHLTTYTNRDNSPKGKTPFTHYLLNNRYNRPISPEITNSCSHGQRTTVPSTTASNTGQRNSSPQRTRSAEKKRKHQTTRLRTLFG